MAIQPRPRVVGRAVLADSTVSAAWKAQIVAAILDAGWTPPAPDAPLELAVEIALPTAQRAARADRRSVDPTSTISPRPSVTR